MKTILIVLAASLLLAFSSALAGDCRLDLDPATAEVCDRQFMSGAEVCRQMHPSPLDYGDRAMCIGYARDVYNKCTGGCSGNGFR